jgi:hypothetical protein
LENYVKGFTGEPTLLFDRVSAEDCLDLLVDYYTIPLLNQFLEAINIFFEVAYVFDSIPDNILVVCRQV